MGALWSYFHNDDDDEEEEYTHITYDSDAYWDAKFEEEKNAVSDDDDDDDDFDGLQHTHTDDDEDGLQDHFFSPASRK